MATYNSEEISLMAPAGAVYSKLSNLDNLRSLLEKVPADKLEMFNSISVTPDSVTVPGGPVGALTFRMKEKVEPTLIKLAGEGLPPGIALSLSLHITPEGESTSKAKVTIDISIPAMLKPMVSGPLQKMADQFGQVLRAIPFA